MRTNDLPASYRRFIGKVMQPVQQLGDPAETEVAARTRLADEWWHSIEPGDRFSFYLAAKSYMERHQ